MIRLQRDSLDLLSHISQVRINFSPPQTKDSPDQDEEEENIEKKEEKSEKKDEESEENTAKKEEKSSKTDAQCQEENKETVSRENVKVTKQDRDKLVRKYLVNLW